MWTPPLVREKKRSLEERRGAISISLNGCHATDRAHVSGGELLQHVCGARLLDASFTLPGFAQKDRISSRNDLSTPAIRFVHFDELPHKSNCPSQLDWNRGFLQSHLLLSVKSTKLHKDHLEAR